MIPAPKPFDEADRLSQLRELAVLDSPADCVLDEMVACAAVLTDCPVALVTLVDADRQWLMAKVGTDATETSRDIAFCAYTILGDGLFEVPDSTLDVRFFDNPLVTGALQVRFYAGVPIVVGRHQIGSLCVIDTKPRQLGERERKDMVMLAKTASSYMTLQYQRRGTRGSSLAPMRSWEQVEPELNPGGGLHLSLRRH